MNTVQELTREVATARNQYLDNIAAASEEQALWKPAPEEWNLVEITEHLFWAEQGAILGMWKTLYAIRNGQIPKTYDSPHKQLPIQQIIEKTWQPKEKVPLVAAPRLGGTLSFWRSSLSSLQPVLEKFASDLQEDELRLLAHPHPISGPLDFQQRLEFLKFHLYRHQEQASTLLELIKQA